jgi:hypothetical protein
VALPAEQRFARSSAVGRYWLARCEGFRVQSGSRDVGRIEQVRCASWQGDAYSLVIKGYGRRISVSVDRVLEVDPWAETVVLAPSRRLRKQLSRSAVAATKVSEAARVAAKGARRYAPIVVERSRVATSAAERGSRRAMAWSTPQARRGALVGKQWAARLAGALAAAWVLVAGVVADGLAWLRPRVREVGCGARGIAQRALSRTASRFTSARRPV